MSNEEQRPVNKIDLTVWGWFGIGFFLVLIIFGIFSGRQGEGLLAFLATSTTTPAATFTPTLTPTATVTPSSTPTLSPIPTNTPTPTIPSGYPGTEDEYSIYSELLEEIIWGDHSTIVLVKEKMELFFPDDIHIIANQVSGFNFEGWDNFILLEEKSIEDHFINPGYEIILINEIELRLIFDNPEPFRLGWENFNDKYPNSPGYIKFSEVAFHPYRLEAIVYRIHVCGFTCGTGIFYYLKYYLGEWRVFESVWMWIS